MKNLIKLQLLLLALLLPATAVAYDFEVTPTSKNVCTEGFEVPVTIEKTEGISSSTNECITAPAKEGETPEDPYMQGVWIVLIDMDSHEYWYRMTYDEESNQWSLTKTLYTFRFGISVRFFFMIDGVRYGAESDWTEPETLMNYGYENENCFVVENNSFNTYTWNLQYFNDENYISILIYQSYSGPQWYDHEYHYVDVYDFEVDGIYYNIVDRNSVCVTYASRYYSSDDSYTINHFYFGNIAIPETVLYDGVTYTVNFIDEYAFNYCTGLLSVTIPNSITSIGSSAFYGCSGLTSVTIPNSITSIGSSAFYGCCGLSSVTIPNSVTNIERAAFQGCTAIDTLNFNAISCADFNSDFYKPFTGLDISTINIGEDVLRIPAFFADGLTKLNNITIPSSVTTIGDYAFSGCSSLSSIIIPGSVVSIGECIFFDCSSLSSIVVDISNPEYDSRDNCNAIIKKSNNELVVGCKNTVIPYGVTSIGDCAFSECFGLTSITIPSSVKSIGDQAFYECSGLTSITLPEGVTNIGNYAFYECSALTSITIPSSMASIGTDAFYNCSSLTSIAIPEGVTSIGNSTFSGCSGLTSITIPSTVVFIGDYAFWGCSSLKQFYCFIQNPSIVTIDGGFFGDGGLGNCTLYVPLGSKAAYQDNPSWYPYFGSIVEMGSDILATSIELNQTAAEVTEGETLQLAATVLPENATDKSVNWTSGNSAVATVDENGLVTAVAPGTATITATTVDGSNLSASCLVTVIENQVNYDNYLSMADTAVFHGETIVIPVKMTNETSIISFQTDIFLPEGLELLQEDGEYIIDPSSRMTRTHSIMSNAVSNGAVRVLCYSSNYKPFTGESGDDLFYITVKVADDAEGDYTIQLKNTLLTNTDFVDLIAPDVAANVNVKAYLLGDANNSGTVSVTDVVVTAQYVLELNPQPFIFDAADANLDGNITVADVSRIAWMVLNPSLNTPQQLRAPALWNNGDLMRADGITLAAGETRRVSILLDNEMDYAAFQLDLNLPAGLTAGNFQLTDRASGHAFDVNVLRGGKIRALCYTPALTAISGHEGALLTFDVTATGTVKGDITVDGIELVTPTCQTVNLDGFAIGVNNSSVVNELKAGKSIARVDYFNLAGQQVDRPDSGVTLVVTTYTDGTRTTTKIIR